MVRNLVGCATGEGGGNGEFERVETIHDDPGWNTYIVAKKQPPTAGSKDAARAARAR